MRITPYNSPLITNFIQVSFKKCVIAAFYYIYWKVKHCCQFSNISQITRNWNVFSQNNITQNAEYVCVSSIWNEWRIDSVEPNMSSPNRVFRPDQRWVLIPLSQRTLGCQPQKLGKVKLEHARSVKKKRGPSKRDFIHPNLWILISPEENISKQYN